MTQSIPKLSDSGWRSECLKFKFQIIDHFKQRYPGSEHPVLALKGAPASFPMKKRNRALQVYLVWSDNITRIGDEYRSNVMKNEDYIGVHLRMGQDWVREQMKETWTDYHFSVAHCLSAWCWRAFVYGVHAVFGRGSGRI